MQYSLMINLENIHQSVSAPSTTPDLRGEIFKIAKPTLGVPTHDYHNDDLIDPFFDGIDSSYDGPVVLAQDLMVINVMSVQIDTCKALTDMLSWTVPAPKSGKNPTMASPSKAKRPDWVTKTKIERKV
jgi:ribonuclease Z